MECGTQVLSPFKRKGMDLVEKVQNSFTIKLMIRMLGFIFDEIPSRAERNRNLGLLKFTSRRKTNDLLMLHKILSDKCVIELAKFILLSPGLAP